jgi:hypothetical protein
MGAGFTRRDAASTKGTVMSEIVTETPAETPAATETPVVETVDAPLGAPGLAALQAERDAHAAAVKRLKEYEDRDKTETQKLAERAEAAEKRAAELETRSVRAEVAAAKGVPANLLSGSTQAELEASADALIAFRGEKSSTPLVVPKEGNSPTPQPNSDSEFVKSLFSSGD